MAHSTTGLIGAEQHVIKPRVAAFVVDYLLSLALALAVSFLLMSAGVMPSRGGFVISTITLIFAYYVLCEGQWGRTPGKRAFGLVVVTTDGLSIGYRASVVRNVFRVVDGVGNYLLGLLVMLLTDRRQRVGDLAADTVVVRARR